MNVLGFSTPDLGHKLRSPWANEPTYPSVMGAHPTSKHNGLLAVDPPETIGRDAIPQGLQSTTGDFDLHHQGGGFSDFHEKRIRKGSTGRKNNRFEVKSSIFLNKKYSWKSKQKDFL